MATSQLSDIYRFQAVTANLGTAGQPTAEQFDAVKDAGYEVVINLALGPIFTVMSKQLVLTGSIMRTFPWCLTHRPTTISPSFSRRWRPTSTRNVLSIALRTRACRHL